MKQMKKKTNDELKAVSIMKRTCSDINQLYGELSNALSEEYLNDDNSHVASDIKEALEVINDLHEEFLIKSKAAISTLIKSENTENANEKTPLEVLNESFKKKDEDLEKDDIVIKPL